MTENGELQQFNSTEDDFSSILTSVRINKRDWRFCKERKLQFSTLLRTKINDIRENVSSDPEKLSEILRIEQNKRRNFQEILERAIRFIERNELIDKFYQETQ